MAEKEKPAEGAEATPEAAEPNKKKKKIILFGGIGAGVVVLLAVVFLVFGGKKKELSAKAGEEVSEHAEDGAHGEEAAASEEHGEKKEEAKTDDHGKEKKDEHAADKKDDKADAKKDEHGESKGEEAAPTDGKSERKKQDEASTVGEMYSIPRMDLNLGNPIENRFLRVSMSLEYRGGESQGEELKKRQAQFNDIIITTVSSKTRIDLITETGKNRLRRELLNKFNEICEKPIAALYFTEFVVE